MTDDEYKDLGEKLLRANATAENIGHELAELCRQLMRGAISNAAYGNEWKCGEQLTHILRLIGVSENAKTHDVIAAAIADLSDVRATGYEELWVPVTKDAVQLYLEITSKDNFGRARASKRLDSLERELKWLPERIERWRAR